MKLVEELPDNAERRSDIITEELKKLNGILPKLQHNFTVKLHASLKDMAKKVTKASGEVLGYMSVNYDDPSYHDWKQSADLNINLE